MRAPLPDTTLTDGLLDDSPFAASESLSYSEAALHKRILACFVKAGAIEKGHFILSSGRHSRYYLNKTSLTRDTRFAREACGCLASSIRQRLGERCKAIVSPAMGAVLFGYETARLTGRQFYFLEREKGQFCFRRGVSPAREACILVEDVLTTGKSVLEAIAALRAAGCPPAAVFCLVDRSGERINFEVPYYPLSRIGIKSYAANALPSFLRNIPACMPGSRALYGSAAR